MPRETRSRTCSKGAAPSHRKEAGYESRSDRRGLETNVGLRGPEEIRVRLLTDRHRGGRYAPALPQAVRDAGRGPGRARCSARGASQPGAEDGAGAIDHAGRRPHPAARTEVPEARAARVRVD